MEPGDRNHSTASQSSIRACENYMQLKTHKHVRQASETSELSPGDIPASLDAGHPRLVQGCSAPGKVMQNQKTLKGRTENINQQSCLTLSSCQSCFVLGHNELCPNDKCNSSTCHLHKCESGKSGKTQSNNDYWVQLCSHSTSGGIATLKM